MITTRPLRLLHINTTDLGGGAEAVALELHRASLARGWSSRLVVGRRRLDAPGVSSLDEVAPSLRGRWRTRLRDVGDSLAPDHPVLASTARALAHPWRAVESLLGVECFEYPATWRLLDAPVDVIHVHNLHGDYFDLRALAPLSRRAPLVVTLHDDWLFTGHCAAAVGCERWRSGCGACPDLRLYPAVRRDATAFNWRRKQRVLADARLHAAAPSQRLLERARGSLLAPTIVDERVIPNGVDLAVFRPGPRAEARRRLELPAEGRLLLFVGVRGRANEFKDFPGLLRAADLLSERLGPLTLVVLGEEAAAERHGAVEVRFARVVDDARRMASYYQAADVYVHATRTESATPRAVQEAMACSRPVVATAVGAVPEQLEDGRTALLVPPGDPAALAAAIGRVLEDEALAARLSAAAAAAAVERFDARARRADYLDWYEELARATRPR